MSDEISEKLPVTGTYEDSPVLVLQNRGLGCGGLSEKHLRK